MSVATQNIKTVRLPKRNLAFVRHVGPYMGRPELFERLFRQVMDWATPLGLLDDPEVEAITVYHDHPEQVPEAEQRISVGFTVPAGTPTSGDIQLLEIPEGRYAIGTFEILPTEYGNAWEEMFQFIGQEKLIPAAMMYESYKNDPYKHPEGKHLVDIGVHLAA